MKNIQEILSDFGLAVPEEKAGDFDKVFRENYKTVKEVGKIEAARDKAKEQLAAAETTLQKFDGIDPDKIGTELETYKKAAETAEKKYTGELQRAWLDKKLDEYGVTSGFARRQLVADCMQEDSGLRWKDGAFFGFNDFMKAAKEKDGSLYQTAEEKAAAENAAKLRENAPFTAPVGDPGAKGDKKFTPPKIF